MIWNEEVKVIPIKEVKKKSTSKTIGKTKKKVKAKKPSNDTIYPGRQKIRTKTLSEKPPTERVNHFWRGTDYNYELFYKKYEEYIKMCEDSWYQLRKSQTDGLTSSGISWENKLDVKLPSIEWFAIYTWFLLQIFYTWEKKHEGFKDILDGIRKLQAQRLLEGGLSGKYNPTIAKLILSKHWYVEKTEVDNNVRTINVWFASDKSPFIKEEKKDDAANW